MGAFRVGARPGKFVLAFFGKTSAERVVGVCPDFGVARCFFDFGADEFGFLNRIGNIGFSPSGSWR